jgi:hypothetical protein
MNARFGGNMIALKALTSLVVAFSSASHASEITWMLENATFTGGVTATGQFEVNTATDSIDTWNISLSPIPSGYASSLSSPYNITAYPIEQAYFSNLTNTFDVFFHEAFADSNITNVNLATNNSMASSALDIIPLDITNSYIYYYKAAPQVDCCELFAQSGFLQQLSPIPEPSSFALVFIAGLALSGTMAGRKRHHRRLPVLSKIN